MESITTLVLKIEAATPKELGEVLDALNREVHSENDWNSISVKAAYINLLSAIDTEIGNFSTYLAFGNDTMDYEDCSTGEQLTFNVRQALGNLNIAKEYFYNRKHQTVDIIKLNGSVELGPIVELADVIVDIVETGSTLKANRLEVLEEVLPISARMIVNQVSMQMKTQRIREMIDRVRDCLV